MQNVNMHSKNIIIYSVWFRKSCLIFLEIINLIVLFSYFFKMGFG